MYPGHETNHERPYEELWNENRAHTYYQDGMATDERAAAMVALAAEIHSQIINLAGQSHECLCE